MTKTKLFLLVVVGVLANLTCLAQKDTIIYAHRGFRGLMPENTIPAMLNALHHGADILEMDISFSKDKYPIVSHDPWMNYLITLDPNGNEIAKGKDLPLYNMVYADIRKYDVGSKQHKDFPMQRNFKAYKPKLIELIDAVETHVRKNKLEKPWYSIETKTSKSRDGIFQPAPEEFVKLLMAVIIEKKIQDRVIIQSFDERTLEIVHRDFPKVKTMLNVSKGSLEKNMARLTFKLDYYAPVPRLIDAQLVKECKELGIKLIGGNTNDKAEIDRILALGVDSYCTDYPYALLP